MTGWKGEDCERWWWRGDWDVISESGKSRLPFKASRLRLSTSFRFRTTVGMQHPGGDIFGYDPVR